MMRKESPSILFLTKYSKNGASSRYRTLQYIPYVEQVGITCVVSPLFNNDYLGYLYKYGKLNKYFVLRAFFSRLKTLFKARDFNLIVIQYEIFPYFPAVIEKLLKRLSIPYIVDYDDALFHQYDDHRMFLVRKLFSNKIAKVMRGAELVIAGNTYLANYARLSGAPWVEVIPTVVDLNRYPKFIHKKTNRSVFTIGWIGSPSTAKYLERVSPALIDVCTRGPNLAQVLLIGAGSVIIPGLSMEILEWDSNTEVEQMSQFDVGIMPLPDEAWERGKCGFKLIQYMACGLPVVASPVGVNSEIVEESINGFYANSHESWVEALSRLRDNYELRLKMGLAGRKVVESNYSLQVTSTRFSDLLCTVINRQYR